MSTTIEWTQRPGTKGETWNPVVGCTKVSPGCKHCYAEELHDRRHKAYTEGKLQNLPQYAKPFRKVQLMHERLTLPLKWKQPRTVFVNSMSDLFHEEVPYSFVDQVFAVMALTPQHTYQVLTKRPERMEEYLCDPQRREAIEAAILQVMDAHGLPTTDVPWVSDRLEALPNVWLGTSVEDQKAADERIPHLLRCPAAVRFLSCEPLLGAVDLTRVLYDGVCVIDCLNGTHGFPLPHAELPKNTGPVHWVIAGGESGPKARPMHPDWARDLRDQCKAAGVPFFFKQWGEWIGGRFDKRKGKMMCQLANKGETESARIFWTKPGAPKVHLWDEADHYWTNASAKVGKRESGRLLDGVEHNEYPARL